MPARDFFDDETPSSPEPEGRVGHKQEFDLDENQIAIAKRLQTKWLQKMEFLLDHGLATSTDLATLSRVLLQNGWTLDERKLPKGLQGMLKQVEFDEDGRPKLKMA
jgi:hypothetical protein